MEFLDESSEGVPRGIPEEIPGEICKCHVCSNEQMEFLKESPDGIVGLISIRKLREVALTQSRNNEMRTNK